MDEALGSFIPAPYLPPNQIKQTPQMVLDLSTWADSETSQERDESLENGNSRTRASGSDQQVS